LKHISSDKDYRNQIVYIRQIATRRARYGDLNPPLSNPIQNVLQNSGITRLYSHQAEAVNAMRQGNHIVVATSTASGKTFCYLIPIIEQIEKNPAKRFLMVYPTKALAQDQLRSILNFIPEEYHFQAGTYDGDTPADLRRKLREDCTAILTNPDMLHQGILPNHPRWARFFTNLSLVVLDEIHTYRGIFGSNVANVIRRLRRICRFYGSNPRFICCSATIGNPEELASRVVGEPIYLIDKDGSPQGARQFTFWNPPPIDLDEVIRASSHTEASNIMTELIRDRVQVITFSRTRLSTEIIYRYVRENLQQDGSPSAETVRAYRGGYLPEDRREIEQKLASGELLGVTSTNALELGIDIGGLDASLIVGYPGTIASTWQQAGRAGRKGEEALVLFIAQNSPIDQFLVKNPEYFFKRNPESAVIDPNNPYILVSHLRCAAYELPLEKSDFSNFGKTGEGIAHLLSHNGQLKNIKDRWQWKGEGYPAADISLRSLSNIIYTIIDITENERVIGTIDEHGAFTQVHTHAVYIHDGETYFVNELDTDKKIAYVEKKALDYYTQSITDVNIRVEEKIESNRWLRNKISIGDVTVTSITHLFKKVKFHTRESIGFEGLKLPPSTIDTVSFWVIPPQSAFHLVQHYGRSAVEGLIGIGNVLVEVIPVFTMSDTSDMGSTVDTSNFGVPTLFIYDRYQGGLGLAERVYKKAKPIFGAALKLIESCSCRYGCPSCVGAAVPSYSVSEGESSTRGKMPDKEAALIVLHEMLGKEPYIPKYKPLRHRKNQTEITVSETENKNIDSPAHKLPARLESKLIKRIQSLKKSSD